MQLISAENTGSKESGALKRRWLEMRKTLSIRLGYLQSNNRLFCNMEHSTHKAGVGGSIPVGRAMI